MPRYPSSRARLSTDSGTPALSSFMNQLLTEEYAVVDAVEAEALMQQETARAMQPLLAKYLNFSDLEYNWIQQWQVDYYINGITELLGTSLAVKPSEEPETYSAEQMVMALRVLKYALHFYKRDEELDPEEEQPVRRMDGENYVQRVLSELEVYPSAQKPLMTMTQLADITEYLAKIFGNSFVRALLQRAVCETPYHMEWKINTPLSLREPSPEPHPPKPEKTGKKANLRRKSKSPRRKSKSPRRKNKGRHASLTEEHGPPTPPAEDQTREAAVQCHRPGLLPLRLATTFPMLYQLYTGEEYKEEPVKTKKHAPKAKRHGARKEKKSSKKKTSED